MDGNIISQVNQKIQELQNIMSQKIGKGGENLKTKDIQAQFNDALKPDNSTKVGSSDINKIEQGGNKDMNPPSPITRDGQPVQDGKLINPAMISSSAGTDGIPPTDFLQVVKANDPYNETNVPVTITGGSGKTDAPETNTEINKELKDMPSSKEHADALKIVEKPVTVKASDEISDIVERVRTLKEANEKIQNMMTGRLTEKVANKESILAKFRERMREKFSKVDGHPIDPVKGSEDAGKTPEESVKSIKTTKAEIKDRPVPAMPEGKPRYKPDPDVRDKAAKDALSKSEKDTKVYMKEPDKDRPVTHKKAALASKLAVLEVFAESDSTWRKENNFPMKIKYPKEQSPDMDFEGSASATEKVISQEHKEREKDKGDITPMKSVLWKDRRPTKTGAKITPEAQEWISNKIKILVGEGKPQDQASAIAYDMARREGYDVPEKSASIGDSIKLSADKTKINQQIQAYKNALKSIKGETNEDMRQLEVLEANINFLEKQMAKLSYVPMMEKAPKAMTWEEIISQGNAIYSDLQRIFGEIDTVTTPFLEEVEKNKKSASIKFAKEEDDDDKGEDKGEKEPKADDKIDDKDDKGKDKKDKKKGKEVKDVAEETIDLLTDIRDTSKGISEDIEEHLEIVEKKTGIPVPPVSEKPEGLGLEGLPPMGLEEEGPPPMPEKGLGEGEPMRLSWIGITPKTAQEEEQLVSEVKKDVELTPEQKWSEIKKLRKTTSWKAVFTKLGAISPAKPKDEKEKEKKDEKGNPCPKSASVDKNNSYWSVFRGDELVLRASVEDLYKEKYAEAFDWASSEEYGKKLLSSILNDGLIVTGEKLGIGSMIKISAEKGGLEKLDPKSYYRKIYPASYVKELFKELKKKSELETSQLKVKLADTEKENETLKKEVADLNEKQTLHAKAEKALSLVKLAVEKGLVEQKEFDNVVDGLMLSNDEGFDSFSKLVLKAPAIKKANTIDEKISMVKNASLKRTENVTLDHPIQIQNQGSPHGMLKSELEKIWKIPPVANTGQ